MFLFLGLQVFKLVNLSLEAALLLQRRQVREVLAWLVLHNAQCTMTMIRARIGICIVLVRCIHHNEHKYLETSSSSSSRAALEDNQQSRIKQRREQASSTHEITEGHAGQGSASRVHAHRHPFPGQSLHGIGHLLATQISGNAETGSCYWRPPVLFAKCSQCITL